MRINGVNEGGNNTPRVFTGAAPVQGVGATAFAIGNVGQAIGDVGADIINQEAREIARQQAEAKQRKDALDRANTGEALLDHEIYVKETSQDIADKVKRGEIKYDEAEKYLDEALGKAPKYKVDDSADPTLAVSYQKGTSRLNFSAKSSVKRAADEAMAADYKGKVDIALDKLGKLAGMPGADIEKINQQVTAYDQLGKVSHGANWEKVKQDFKDNNWFNHASQKVLESNDNVDSLKGVKRELTARDGFYADKLDAGKRTALLKSIDSQLDTLNNRNLHAQDKREAIALRAIGEIDKQVSSAVPATPEQWLAWHEQVKGTPFESEFKARVDDENEVQAVLRKPIEEQMGYVQDKEIKQATKGADLRAQANLNRLKSAVEANVKLLKEQPLIFNQNHTGKPVEPIDIASLASNPGEVAAQLKDRFATVSALRKRYGQEVTLNPFLPQESNAIKAVINKADDETKLTILSTLASASPNATAYGSALKAVAAEKGLLMAAGMAQYLGHKSSEGREVSKTILAGEKILADKSVIMPSEQAFKSAFEEAVGDAIPNGTPQREGAYAIFKAIYAGTAADMGVRHDSIDKNEANEDVARLAIGLTTGGVTDYNDRKVIMPYGMPENTFTKKVETALESVAKQSGYDVDLLEDMPLMPVPGKEGSYYLLNGKKAQTDKNGKAIVVNIK